MCPDTLRLVLFHLSSPPGNYPNWAQSALPETPIAPRGRENGAARQRRRLRGTRQNPKNNAENAAPDRLAWTKSGRTAGRLRKRWIATDAAGSGDEHVNTGLWPPPPLALLVLGAYANQGFLAARLAQSKLIALWKRSRIGGASKARDNVIFGAEIRGVGGRARWTAKERN